MKILKFIYQNLDQFKLRFKLVFLTVLIDSFFVFMIPVLLSEFTKKDFTPSRSGYLITFLISFYCISLVLQWVMRRYGESVGAKFSHHIRLKYFKALDKLPYKKLIRHHSGYTLSLMGKFSDGLTEIILNLFWTFGRIFMTLTLFFIFTARESLFIAIMNVLILAVFFIMSLLLSKKMIPISSELNLKRASLLESYTDFMSNILTVKKLGVHQFAESRLEKKTGETYRYIQKIQNFHSNRWFFLHALYGFAFIGTLSFLVVKVSQGLISVSVLILFIAAYLVMKSMIDRVSEVLKIMMEMSAYLDNLNKVVVLKERGKGAGKDSTPWSEVIFKNIVFKYSGNSRKIEVPQFNVEKGEKICILGKSGGGKTTFLNLFSDFIQPDQGERLVDNVSYKKVKEGFFEEKISIISQEVELFNISLRDNITLDRNMSDKEIEVLLDKVDLLSWIRGLKEGLDTVVGEKGVKLSTGQKQRINLLRGIILDREILLLDEPTSNLDVLTQKKVIDFLGEYLKGKTAIIVSHHDELKGVCDRCYEMKNHILTETNNFK
ncbi:MAG: ABC transporter ATP-binding protein [bacterium]|nr:ABC transporter ATP-binding protein [bacterium]